MVSVIEGEGGGGAERGVHEVVREGGQRRG